VCHFDVSRILETWKNVELGYWTERLEKASEPLSKYAQKARKDPVIVVKKGKPFAAVVPIRNADEETVSLSTNRKFLAIIERSRSCTKKEGAISSKELRRRFGLNK
jgi:antitoxin (DNA-binding transcriptional repressor) of toxin-antitoxin stability system